jgi:hypothetical protein
MLVIYLLRSGLDQDLGQAPFVRYKKRPRTTGVRDVLLSAMVHERLTKSTIFFSIAGVFLRSADSTWLIQRGLKISSATSLVGQPTFVSPSLERDGFVQFVIAAEGKGEK